MQKLQRFLGFGVFVALFLWAAGCGGGGAESARKAQTDLLKLEVEEQEKVIKQLQAMSDSLLKTRILAVEEFGYIRSLSTKTDEELTKIAIEGSPKKSAIFTKIENFVKGLWPF
ncbi:MAG: hypothetical protein FJY97_10755 [candidate division Zixibacteria bacterium]|nr:hypothetical protein [candidate division Zixibacteria bacterium]